MTTHWQYGTKEALIECPNCNSEVLVKIEYETQSNSLRGEDYLKQPKPQAPREVTCNCGRITPIRLEWLAGGDFVLLRMI